MLSEFKCRKCQEKFMVGLRLATNPVRYCVCCGAADLEYLGSEEDLAVRIRAVIDQYNVVQKVK